MTDDRPRRQALAGLLITLLGVFVFSGSNALAKWLVASYPVGETLFFRSSVALLILLPLIGRREIAQTRAGGRFWLHALRCGFSAIEVGCFYWAITAVHLADASAIYLACPIYVTAMGALFLGERVGWARWAAVLAGFAGVLVALQPGAGSLSPQALVAVGGSLLYAVSLAATRRLRGTPNIVLVASQVAALNLLCLATAPFGWIMPSPRDGLALALVGLISLAGYLCVNRGLQLAPASAVAPFQYSSIVWTTVLGYAVFGEAPSMALLLGSAIIVAAGVAVVLAERRAPVPVEG